MQVSYSRISTHEKCPYQYKLRYLDKLQTLFNCDPQNALVLGHALHTGIEKDVTAAVEEYYNAYPIIDDAHVTEAMKLEYLIPKVKALLPNGKHEVKIETDDFVGFIDLLVPTQLTLEERDEICNACEKYDSCETCTSGHCEYGKYEQYYDLYDFKYSNNVDSYMESAQLHLYKYFFELTNPGKRIRNLYFVFVPKCNLRIKYKNKTNPRDETIYEFRKRCLEDLESKEIRIEQIQYDPNKVIEYLMATKHCIEDTEYIKNPTRLCDWCDYKDYCQKGIDYMNLPKNERRDIEVSNKKKIWLYAQPFAGKTTLTDKFPDPLILTTDGNIKNVTAPYVYIKDEVTVSGRMTNRKFAWEVFKETLDELEKKQNDFKTITLDLVEDTREMCRLYMYDKMGIQHESDSGYGKGWDVIKTEYLSTMRRFFNLDYDNIIICSHEDVTKSITKKSGESITRIAPNIQEAIATKLAGMVDIVARIIVNDDNSRTISFKTDSVIFGGGRLNVTGKEIPCTYDDLMEVYDEASNVSSEPSQKRTTKKADNSIKKETTSAESDSDTTESIEEIVGQDSHDEQKRDETPKKKRRTSKNKNETSSSDSESSQESVDKEDVTTSTDEEKAVESDSDTPKRRTRKKRG